MRWLNRAAARRTLDVALWMAVLGVLAWRLVPQLTAAAGVGGAGGEPVPALTLQTLDGAPLPLASLRGRVVLVNFWATWCPPCRLEMPAFQRTWASRGARGLVVVGISEDRGGEAEVRRFLAERGVTYPVAMDDGRAGAAFGGVRALPTSFLIDRRGVVRHRVEGFFAEPLLAGAVDRLLAEPAAGAGEGAR
jgi:peroxiredoxin